jgi:Ca2+-binding EF-hand superfamily protein
MKEFSMHKYALVGLLAAAASPLVAQVAPVAPAAPMVRMSPMMNQTITRADVQARVQAHFAKRDANRDGVLTADELKMRGNEHVVVMRHGGGMPHDMTGPHTMGDPNAAFDRLDANRDGAISRDEFARGRQVRIERRVIVDKDGKPGADHKDMERGKMGAIRGMHRRMGGMIGGGALFQLADANHDGRVTLAEATSGALRHFDMMDTNRDGRLTPDERAAGHVRMMQMHKAG